MVIGLITARADSKGLPGKNMLELGGKPLIAHTVETALESGAFDKVVLNTDMDAAIDLVKSRYPQVEVPFKRPAELASDTASHADLVKHYIGFCEENKIHISHVVILQPTTPFKTAQELKEGVDMLKSGAESVIGVSKAMHHPAEYVYADAEGKLQFLMKEFAGKRRQEYPEIYFDNGAFYGFSVDFFRENGAFFNEHSKMLMMGEKSLIDIDTPFEFALAQGLINVGYKE